MFKSHKQLLEQIENLQSENEELASKLSNLENLQVENEVLIESEGDFKAKLEKSTEKIFNLESTIKGLTFQVAEKDQEIESLKEKNEQLEKDFKSKVKTAAQEKTVELLSESSSDITLAEASAKEENTQDFESRYKAAKKAGGTVHSRFVRDNRKEIRAYFESLKVN